MSQTGTLRLDLSYAGTVVGIVHLAEVGIDLICMICTGQACKGRSIGFVWFTVITSFFLSLWTLAVNLFHVKDVTTRIPWHFWDLGRTGVFGFFAFVSFLIACINSRVPGCYSPWTADAVFLLALMLLLFYQSYQAYLEWQRGGRSSIDDEGVPPNFSNPSVP